MQTKNTKGATPLQDNGKPALSHETASQLKAISISLFDGGETPEERNGDVWLLLSHAMLSPEANDNIERANMVELCKLHVKFISLLYSIYNSQTQQKIQREFKIITKDHPIDIHLNGNLAKEVNEGEFKNSFFVDYNLHKEEILNKHFSGDFYFEIETLIIFNCPIKQIVFLKEILSSNNFYFRKLYSKEFINHPINTVIIIPEKNNIENLVEANP